MTLLGKILVCLNVGLSLAFAAFALGVYLNRVEWGKTAESPGVFDGKKADVTQRQERTKLALTRWQRNLYSPQEGLYAWEGARTRFDGWIYDRLSALETGKDSQGRPEPVRELSYVNGVLQMQNGFPVLKAPAAGELLPREPALQQFAAEEEKLRREMNELDKTVQAEASLTQEINGTPAARGKPRQLGVRDLLAAVEEQERMAKATLERRKPDLYNTLAEAALLARRQVWLAQRKQQLEVVGRADPDR